MINDNMKTIFLSSQKRGWVLEPDAKQLFSSAGFLVPRYSRADRLDDAIYMAQEIGYPIVGKIISSKIIHKTEHHGVVLCIENERKLRETFISFSKNDSFEGMLIEEMISGIELIVGAKIDYQFGPVILLGIGGTGVEIYQDITIRMAPLKNRDVYSMIDSLQGRKIIQGYRGEKPLSKKILATFVVNFSNLVLEMQEHLESIDLNPVICSQEKCVIADARIILR